MLRASSEPVRLAPAAFTIVLVSLSATAFADDDHVASIGEGGRDLATRLYLYRSSVPTVMLELHSGAGDAGALFGPGTQHYRLKPLLLVGADVRAALTVFAAAGMGAAQVVHGVCSDGVATSACSGPTRTTTHSMATIQIGSRFDHPDHPVVTTFEIDSAAGGGTSAALQLAFELDLTAPRL
jgi:hypothetical protein